MADKQAGDLYVELGGNFSSASKGLGNFINRLDKLQTTLNGIKLGGITSQFLQLGNSLKTITTQDLKNLSSLGTRLTSFHSKLNAIDFSGISTQMALLSPQFAQMTSALASVNSIDLKNLSSLGTRMSNLGKKLQEIDWRSVQSGFNSLTVAITPFLNKVIQAEQSLRALNETLTRVNGKKLQGLSNFNVGEKTTVTKSSTGFLSIVRWSAIFYGAKRVAKVVADIAQSGADYTETLNLWQTAMGENLTLATEFVNKMNEAYGISEKTLMNAQATFKNMLGGLGNISDQVAYGLSEGITQMAVDYASLYNQTFEQAFTKFQAALAGQVRPIRSVSGFDITEQTLFALYQELGGTKTMRQLNRTEKQLLSILAIFQQMSATGAVGDLNKTMNSFANQSRVMAESWQQVVSYAGVLLTYTIQESGLLTYVNAILIFIGDTLKAVAEELGAIQSFADPFETITDGALTATEATDELQGKLLDFDKFRSLSGGAEENALGLDEKLLQAFSNFDSILANANMEARNLAETWKQASGLFDSEGVFDKERWDEIIDALGTFGKAIVSLISGGIITKLVRALMSITMAGKNLNSVIVGGIIWAIWEMIDAFEEGDYQTAVLAGTIGTMLVIAWAALNQEMLTTIGTKISKFFVSLSDTLNKKAIPSLLGTQKAVTGLNLAFAALGVAFAVSSISKFMASELDMGRKMTTMFIALAVAIGAAAIAMNALQMNWVQAIGVAGLVAGGVTTILGSLDGVDMFANGGLPDKGTMFVAGEAGAEIVYNTPSGQSGVANVKQIKNAMYQALVEYGNSHNRNQNEPIIIKIGEEEVFRATRQSAKRQGLDFVKV